MMHASDTADTHATSDDRISAFRIDDGLVIYDVEDEDCWLQSDAPTDLVEAR